MPFTVDEARDWAEMLEEIREKFSAGAFDENDLAALVETIEECIGRDAEAGGWYGEWEEILDGLCKPKNARDEKREAIARIKETEADREHARCVQAAAAKLGISVEGFPLTVPQLLLSVYDEIQILAGAGINEKTIVSWPLPKQFPTRWSLGLASAQRIQKAFRDAGYEAELVPAPGRDDYMVSIRWCR